MNRDKLNELLERVKAATGPDRELDEAIRFYFDPRGSVFYSESDAYTGSIDAALALVERMLPGWLVSIDQLKSGWLATLVEFDREDDLVIDDYDAEAPTAPLSVLAALLEALTQSNDTQEE